MKWSLCKKLLRIRKELCWVFGGWGWGGWLEFSTPCSRQVLIFSRHVTSSEVIETMISRLYRSKCIADKFLKLELICKSRQFDKKRWKLWDWFSWELLRALYCRWGTEKCHAIFVAMYNKQCAVKIIYSFLRGVKSILINHIQSLSVYSCLHDCDWQRREECAKTLTTWSGVWSSMLLFHLLWIVSVLEKTLSFVSLHEDTWCFLHLLAFLKASVFFSSSK